MSTIKKQFRKTKLCPYQQRGYCYNGPQCSYAHTDEELQPLPDLRQTKMCEYTKKNLPCPNYATCSYAHDVEDLRPSTDLATFKTSLCFFWRKGRCFNGAKCRFAHGINEMRPAQAITGEPDSNPLEDSKEQSDAFQKRPACENAKPTAPSSESNVVAQKKNSKHNNNNNTNNNNNNNNNAFWQQQPSQSQLRSSHLTQPGGMSTPLCPLPLQMAYNPLTNGNSQPGYPYIPNMQYRGAHPPPHPAMQLHNYGLPHHPNFPRMVGLPYMWGNGADWQRGFLPPPIPKEPKTSFSSPRTASPHTERKKRSSPVQANAGTSRQVSSSGGTGNKQGSGPAEASKDKKAKNGAKSSAVAASGKSSKQQSADSSDEHIRSSGVQIRGGKGGSSKRNQGGSAANGLSASQMSATSSSGSLNDGPHGTKLAPVEQPPSLPRERLSSWDSNNMHEPLHSKVTKPGKGKTPWGGTGRRHDNAAPPGSPGRTDSSETSLCLTRSLPGFSDDRGGDGDSESIAPPMTDSKRGSLDATLNDDTHHKHYEYDDLFETGLPSMSLDSRLNSSMDLTVGQRSFSREVEASTGSTPYREVIDSGRVTQTAQEQRATVAREEYMMYHMLPPDYHDMEGQFDGRDGSVGDSGPLSDSNAPPVGESRASSNRSSILPTEGSESLDAMASVVDRWNFKKTSSKVESDTSDNFGLMSSQHVDMTCKDNLDNKPHSRDQSVRRQPVDVCIDAVGSAKSSPHSLSPTNTRLSPYPSSVSTPMFENAQDTLKLVKVGSGHNGSYSRLSDNSRDPSYHTTPSSMSPVTGPQSESCLKADSVCGAAVTSSSVYGQSTTDRMDLPTGRGFNSERTGREAEPSATRLSRTVDEYALLDTLSDKRLRERPSEQESENMIDPNTWKYSDGEIVINRSSLPSYIPAEPPADWSPFSSNLSMSLSCLRASKLRQKSAAFPCLKSTEDTPDLNQPRTTLSSPNVGPYDMNTDETLHTAFSQSPSYQDFMPSVCQSLPQSPNLMFQARPNYRVTCHSMPQSPRTALSVDGFGRVYGDATACLLPLSGDVRNSSAGVSLPTVHPPTPPPGLQLRSPKQHDNVTPPPIMGPDLLTVASELDSWQDKKSRSLPPSPSLSASLFTSNLSPGQMKFPNNENYDEDNNYIPTTYVPTVNNPGLISPSTGGTSFHQCRFTDIGYHKGTKTHRHRSMSPPSASTQAGYTASPSPPSTQKFQSPEEISPPSSIHGRSFAVLEEQSEALLDITCGETGQKTEPRGRNRLLLNMDERYSGAATMLGCPRAPSPNQAAGAFESCPLSEGFDGRRKQNVKPHRLHNATNVHGTNCERATRLTDAVYVTDFEAAQRQALKK